MSKKEGRPHYKECHQLVQQKKSMMKKMMDTFMTTRTLRYMYSCNVHCKWFEPRGPFLESPGNFSGPESYFMCSMFTLKTQILF